MKSILIYNGERALVDDEDFEKLSKFNWYPLTRKGYTSYAIRNVWFQGKASRLLMHREILGVKDSEKVDHRDGNGLNNTKENLRIATPTQNAWNARKRRNSSQLLKGVCFDKQHGKFRASIRLNKRLKYLGLFLTPEEAHAAYCQAAKENFREFARIK